MAGTLATWTGRVGDAWHALRAPADGPRVAVSSVPKAGTHLLISALRRVPGVRVIPELVLGKVGVEGTLRRLERVAPYQVLVGHIVYEPRVAAALDARGIRLVLMIRDPRDVVVSLAKYIPRAHVGHRFHDYFTRVLTSDHDRIMACIRGVGGEHAEDGRAQPDIGTLFRSYLAWTEHHAVHTCRFEDLVGPHGGGSERAQLEALQRLAAWLGYGLRDDEVAAIARATFSKDSLTFRKGEIGDFRNHFAPEHEAAFREVAGDLLGRLGYAA
ncbi:MAG: sulfotransferase domain family protein [Acidobacteria bacterium]|nr:sulfotransferase domain family protein [Acidobacteriota bacterium]